MADDDTFVVLFEDDGGAKAARLSSKQILAASRDLRSASAFLGMLLGANTALMHFTSKRPGDATRRGIVMRQENFSPGQRFEVA